MSVATATGSSTLTQVGLLAGRAVAHVLRQPALLATPILFPLILLAVNASGLSAATAQPVTAPPEE